ncbi:hypothetical protein [Pedococcus soli]
MEGTVWGVLIGTVKTIVAILSVPAWFLAAYFVGWFWVGLPSFATCNIGVTPSCARGHGMPQYLTVLVLTISSTLLLLAAASRWHRSRAWLAACLCAIAAWLVATLMGELAFVPRWWLA